MYEAFANKMTFSCLMIKNEYYICVHALLNVLQWNLFIMATLWNTKKGWNSQVDVIESSVF